MKVLAVNNLYPPDVIGGYEIACRQMVDALRDAGHAVTVLTASPRTPVETPAYVLRRMRLCPIFEAYVAERSAHATLDLLLAESNGVQAFNVYQLLEALREVQPDVVYLGLLTGVGGLGLLGALAFLNVPWVWFLADAVPKFISGFGSVPAAGLAAAYSKLIRGTYAPMSWRLVDEIQDAGVKLVGPVETTGAWVTGRRPAARETFYTPASSALRMMYAGQMVREKGVHVLIEAGKMLLGRGLTRWTLDLYGRGRHERDFARQISEWGLEGHITLRGGLPQEALLQRYGEHDLFLFPTHAREPFGMVPVEAAAAGCVPVIAAECGAAERLVEGVHCLKAPRDAAAFADVIARVLNGDVLLEPLGKRAQHVVWRDFHIDVGRVQIERLLHQAARPYVHDATLHAEAHRLAALAEGLARVLVQEPHVPAQR